MSEKEYRIILHDDYKTAWIAQDKEKRKSVFHIGRDEYKEVVLEIEKAVEEKR